jgi:hypothetical protein
MIPLDDCIERHVYKLRSRNLQYGVFNGRTGFIGIREKFGYKYLDTEYHWETGAPFGTATPLEDIGTLPQEIKLVPNMPSRCSLHDRETLFERNPNGMGGQWTHIDDGSFMEDNDYSLYIQNDALYHYLETIRMA